VAADVTDPETGVSIGARHRAKLRVDALKPDATPETKTDARTAADASKDFPIGALGSGSDFSAFLQHLGVPAIDVSFMWEGDPNGVYHSAYDTFAHHSRFVDPGFVYDATLAKTIGRLVLRLADSPLPLQQAGAQADVVAMYLDQLKELASHKRDAADAQAAMLRDDVFHLAADPTQPGANPTALDRVPYVNFAPLENAVDRLKRSARDYDASYAKGAAALPADRVAKLQALMQTIDQTLAPDVGLPDRPWYKNLLYAPGRYTGYGAKTMPGVREAIEDQRWADADRYAKLTADAINAYSDRLDQARAVIDGR